MTKLSTDKLKELIGTWLSKPELRDDMKHHTDDIDVNRIVNDWESKSDITEMEYCRRLWKAPPSVQTPEQLEEFIWGLWCNGSRWKRQEKRQLKEEWQSYFATYDWDNKPAGWKHGDELPLKRCAQFDDFAGWHDPALVTKYFNDREAAAKCIFRCFSPDNQLADNYRLEVVTTPEDDAVVGWLVIVD